MKIRKNPKANLENKRKVFLEIGFIFALIMVLLAFEYRSYEKYTPVLTEGKSVDVFEEFVPITKDKPEIPKPPPVKYQQIKITNDKLETRFYELPDIYFDDNPDQKWAVYEEPPEVIPDDTPIRFSSDPAEFPGGLSEMYKFLADNIVYPATARELGIQGKVYIDFVIEKDGSVSNVKLVKGIGFGCDEEAMRVIWSMPKWKPAKQNFHTARMAMTIPVKFTLK